MKSSKSKNKDDGEPSEEGKAFKRKMLQTPPNHAAPEIQEDSALNKKVDSKLKPAQMPHNNSLPSIQDVYPMADSELKMTKEKIAVPTPQYPDLDPGLKDLVLKATKTKGGRVCRPPNAFMLFAKENRASVGAHNPNMKNGEKSLLLGAMWRSITNEGRQKYYNDANALDKLHKETYPDYTYCPREARKQKQEKLETKLKKKASKKTEKRFTSPESCDDDLGTLTSQEKQSNYEIKPSSTSKVKQSDSCNTKFEDNENETKCHYEIKKDTNSNNPNRVLLLRLTKSNVSSENSSRERLKLNVKSQEKELKPSSQINKDGMKKDKSFVSPKQPLAQRPVNLLNTPTPRYMPYYKRGEQKMPMTGHPEPCMHCPFHGMDRKYVEYNNSNLPIKENIPSASSYHTYLPANHNSYFPYHPLYNNAFYPSVFNPWMVWPGRYYNQVPYGYSNKHWMSYGLQALSDTLYAPKTSGNKRKLSSTATECPEGVKSSTVFGGSLKDQRMMKNVVEPSNAFGGPLKDNRTKRIHVESSTVFDAPLKDELKNKKYVESQAAVVSGSFVDESEDDEFKDLVIDIDGEDSIQ